MGDYRNDCCEPKDCCVRPQQCCCSDNCCSNGESGIGMLLLILVLLFLFCGDSNKGGLFGGLF